MTRSSVLLHSGHEPERFTDYWHRKLFRLCEDEGAFDARVGNQTSKRREESPDKGFFFSGLATQLIPAQEGTNRMTHRDARPQVVSEHRDEEGNTHVTATAGAGGQIVEAHASHPDCETARCLALEGAQDQANVANKRGANGDLPTH